MSLWQKDLVKIRFSQDKLLLLLIVIALILGYQVLAPRVNFSQLFTQKSPSPIATPQPTASPESEETMLFKTPAKDAPQTEKDQHMQLAIKLAQTTESLDINGCQKPVPLVFQVKNGANFKVVNNDTVEYKLRLDKDYAYTLPPKKTTTIKASFGHGAGVYGYGCDGKAGAVGFFFVTP